MAFKLPSLRGKCNSDKSQVCLGLPLFEWEKLRDKEDAIGRGSFGLVFVPRTNSEKVVIKKLVSEDDQEKRLFMKRSKKRFMGLSEHIFKFTESCMH